MRKASSILVVTKPSDLGGDAWPRFLAILCFVEFCGLEADRCPECGVQLRDTLMSAGVES
jgi:hypothetical protein